MIDEKDVLRKFRQLSELITALDESGVIRLVSSTVAVNSEDDFSMATFKIDDVEYDTDKLDTTQKRVVGLYQKSLQDEGAALNSLEIARAARIELGRKLKELVISPAKK